jgi:hypothetical protein
MRLRLGRRKHAAALGDDLPRLPLRRRVLIALLAVAVAVAVMALLIYRPGDPKRGLPFAARPAASDTPRVGGKADVILVAPAASR